MYKKYIVRLGNEERQALREVVRKLKGSSARVRRAQILLKADADGPNWTDQRIADAFGCRTRTVENVRQRLVTEGFEAALERKQPASPPRAKLLDGQQEAKIIALRLGKRRKGLRTGRCGCWQTRSWNWGSSIRSAMKRCARR